MNNQEKPIVDAEVIEENSAQVEDKSANKSTDKKHNKKHNKKQSSARNPVRKGSENLFRMLVIFVSGLALAIAISTWFQLQKVTQAWLDNLQINKSAIVEMQQKVTSLENQINNQPKSNIPAEINQTINEMQLMIKSLMAQDNSQIKETPDLRETPEDTGSTNNQATEEKIANLSEDVSQALAEMQQKLKDLEAIAHEKSQDLSGYLNSQDWEEDKQAIEETLNILGEKIKNLSDDTIKHSEMLSDILPQLEKKFEEIQPRLKGFGERINQLFSIRKYEPEENQ